MDDQIDDSWASPDGPSRQTSRDGDSVPETCHAEQHHGSSAAHNGHRHSQKRRTQVTVTSHRPYSEKGAVDGANTHRRRHFLLSWWQEIAACILSVGALMAMFGTLYHYENKPSPDWPSWITLNTLISIFTVILKAGILLVTSEALGQLRWSWLAAKETRSLDLLSTYNDTVRGSSKAALSLIWKLKFSYLLASAGALIIVLTFAIDPFAQQILHYHACEIIDQNPTAVPTLPRTNLFDALGYHTGAGINALNPSIQTAINAGLVNTDATPDANCDSGNCTWSTEYSSVGWCSSCEDVSNQLTFTNLTYFDYDYNTTLWSIISSLSDGGPVVNMTSSSLGVPQLASMGFYNGPLNGTQYASAYPAALDFILGKNPSDNMDPISHQPWPDCSNPSFSSTWRCVGFGAARCQLFPCVKTYTASVNTGTLNETLQSTAATWSPTSDSQLMTTLDTHCINPSERQALQALNYTFDDNARWLAYNSTFRPTDRADLNDTFPWSMAQRDCLYSVDASLVLSANNFFDTLFNGTVLGRPIFGGGASGLLQGPAAVQTIFNFGNVTFARVNDVFAGVAAALTTYARTQSSPDWSQAATGVESVTTTCTTVQWPWMAFASALLAFTLLVFGLTVVKTRPKDGDGVEIWKASSLPMFYQNFVLGSEENEDEDEGEDGRGSDARPPEDLRRMRARAGNTRVAFKKVVRHAVSIAVENVKDSF